MKTSIKAFLLLACSVLIANTAITLPLFDAYPKLKKAIPHLALGNIETTPIVHAKFFESKGVQLYLKNDGIYGTDKHGNKIFSGNKRRKLEFLLADALAHHAKRVYALGGAGSNFATATAAYTKELGLACTLILGPQRNTRYVQRNLKLDLFYGANIVACPTREERTTTCQKLAQGDPSGYFIPLGGSNSIGALGFVNAAFELKQQITQGIMPQPDVIYIACSSAAMAAGLIVGLKAAKLDIVVRPVRIDDTPEETSGTLSQLIQETSTLLHQHDATIPLISIAPDKLNMVNDVAGEEYVPADHNNNQRHRMFDAYALTTPQGAHAIQTLDKATGIKLEGTYSGKAFVACLRDITSGSLSGKKILFWDSFCAGTFDEYTNSVDVKKLPEELQKYIYEAPGYHIQPYDMGV